MTRYIIKKIFNFLILKNTINATRFVTFVIIGIYILKIFTILVSILPLVIEQFMFNNYIIDIYYEQFDITFKSDNNNSQYTDKGKGKAIDYINNENNTGNKRSVDEDSSSEEERQIKKAKLESLKDSKDDTKEGHAESSRMQDQKLSDLKLPSSPEEDKDLQKAIYLSYNSKDIDYTEDSEGSEYSVYSSEHSYDSDNTKLTKRAIKEIEKTLPKKNKAFIA
jgi:hypothetical protein